MEAALDARTGDGGVSRVGGRDDRGIQPLRIEHRADIGVTGPHGEPIAGSIAVGGIGVGDGRDADPRLRGERRQVRPCRPPAATDDPDVDGHVSSRWVRRRSS